MLKEYSDIIAGSMFVSSLFIALFLSFKFGGASSRNMSERLVIRSCKDHFPVHDYGLVKDISKRDGYVKFELVDGRTVKLSEGTCYTLDGEVNK